MTAFVRKRTAERVTKINDTTFSYFSPGAAITTKCLSEMERGGHAYGLVSLCIGGGQGIALLIENPEKSVALVEARMKKTK